MNELIPKKIHQIWVGKKEIPNKYEVFMKNIKKLHGEFEHYLWTNKDINKDNFSNYEIIMSCESPAQKADLMRYEILYKHGGTYLDVDFELFKSISDLLIRSLVLCNEAVVGAKNYMANSFIGCNKNNKNLLNCVLNAKNIDFSKPINEATGPYYFRKNIEFKEKRYMRKIGYKSPDTYIVPTHYFYPLHYTNKESKFLIEKETYGVHHWDKNW